MINKRNLLKGALVSLVPFGLSNRAFAQSPGISETSRLLAIITAKLEQLKQLAKHDGTAGLYKAGAAPGVTKGSVTPGSLGERLAPGNPSYTATVSGNGTPHSLQTLSIPPGIWLIHGSTYVTAANAANFRYLSLALSDNGPSFDANHIRESFTEVTSGPIPGVCGVAVQCSRYIKTETPITVTLVARCESGSNTTWKSVGDASLHAVRIG